MKRMEALANSNIQFGTTDFADSVPDCLAPSSGPVYLEGRLVLSLSFQGSKADLESIVDDDIVLENYRLWDDRANTWHSDDLAVLRFEHADVVMRLDPEPLAIWAGSLDTHARVVLVPDLDRAGLKTNQAVDLRWRRV